VIVYVLFVRRA